MQLLYIIGSGSLHYNEELRFSLRSVQRHCPEVTKIVVVGEPVHFLSDMVEYHYIPEAQGNKEYCIGMKVYNACKEGYIKGNFAFMNDDFFFTRPFDWSVNYAKPDLHATSLQYYQKAIHDTKQYLLSLKKTTYHFDVHTPIVYNSKKFLKMLPHLQQSQLTSDGMVVKSLYGNINGLEPTMYNDCKLSTMQTRRDFERAKETPVISCSDGCWSNGMRSYMKSEYPNKSMYEK